MKQVIGYIECDFMNIKYGMLYMIAIFGIVSVAFSMRDGTGAVAYMLFCGLVMSGTAFNTTKQTVSFTALMPGSIWQKVTGRYLGGVLCIMLCAVVGMISTGIVKLMGRANGMLEIPILLCLLGITFPGDAECAALPADAVSRRTGCGACQDAARFYFVLCSDE